MIFIKFVTLIINSIKKSCKNRRVFKEKTGKNQKV